VGRMLGAWKGTTKKRPHSSLGRARVAATCRNWLTICNPRCKGFWVHDLDRSKNHRTHTDCFIVRYLFNLYYKIYINIPTRYKGSKRHAPRWLKQIQGEASINSRLELEAGIEEALLQLRLGRYRPGRS